MTQLRAELEQLPLKQYWNQTVSQRRFIWWSWCSGKITFCLWRAKDRRWNKNVVSLDPNLVSDNGDSAIIRLLPVCWKTVDGRSRTVSVTVPSHACNRIKLPQLPISALMARATWRQRDVDEAFMARQTPVNSCLSSHETNSRITAIG